MLFGEEITWGDALLISSALVLLPAGTGVQRRPVVRTMNQRQSSHGSDAYVGFGLMGLELGCVQPITISAAGRMDPKNAGRNIGIVNGVGHLGFLVGPALLSIVATSIGIQWLFMIPAVLMLFIAVAGPLLIGFAPARVDHDRKPESVTHV